MISKYTSAHTQILNLEAVVRFRSYSDPLSLRCSSCFYMAVFMIVHTSGKSDPNT